MIAPLSSMMPGDPVMLAMLPFDAVPPDTIVLEAVIQPSHELTVPLPPPHAEPLAMWLPLASILTQSPEVCVPAVVTTAVVLPERVPLVKPPLPSLNSGVLAPPLGA